MMTKKKRKMIVIGITVIVLIIFLAILTILYLNTDMFKSSQTLFFKYFIKNYESVNQITEALKNDEYNNVYKTNKYSKSSELKINYTENYGTTSENTNNAINKLKLTIDEENNAENGYQFKDIKLFNNEEKNTEIEYMKNDNTYGIRFSDLFNQYITVENNNLKQLFEKLGLSDEALQSIPDSIEIKNIEDIEFSKEELEKLKDKYLSLVKEKISKDKFSKKNNQTVTINDKNVLANAYIITLTKEQLNNIYLDVLQCLKDDEIILKKIEQIQNFSPINTSEADNINSSLKDMYVTNIEEIIENINRTNIGNEEITISVYENNGVTIKTSIKTPDYEIDFENITTNGEEFSNIIFKENDKETQNIKLVKKQNNLEITIKTDIDSNAKTIGIERSQNTNNNKYNKDINIKYEDNSNKLEANYTETINLLDEIQNVKEFNSDNSIELNGLESEQLSSLLNTVSEELTKKIEKINQEIRIEDIQAVFENLGLINTAINLDIDGVSEAEKTRFNSKFEILQGESLSAEAVLNTINIIKENFYDLQVVSNNELKIEINRNNSNEQLVKTLEDFIQKDKSRNYDVKIEYDDETGLVKYLTLTILEKNR